MFTLSSLFYVSLLLNATANSLRKYADWNKEKMRIRSQPQNGKVISFDDLVTQAQLWLCFGEWCDASWKLQGEYLKNSNIEERVIALKWSINISSARQ